MTERIAEVMTIQAIIQNRLNGIPRTVGRTRSHRGTEKHMPTKGTIASRMEAIDGLLTRGQDSRLPQTGRAECAKTFQPRILDSFPGRRWSLAMAVPAAENKPRPESQVRAPTTRQILAISSLTGAFGVISGYCVFLLWDDRAKRNDWWAFLIGLAVAALASFAIEFLRDVIQHGEADRMKLRRVLVTILTLMMFELFIVAWEDVAPRWHDAQAAANSERLKITLLGPLLGIMKQGHPMLDITVLGFVWVVGGVALAMTLGFAAANPKEMSLRSQLARGLGRGLTAALVTAPVGTVLYVLAVRVVLSVRMMIFDHDAWSGNLRALSVDPNGNVLFRICFSLFYHVYEFSGRGWWGPLIAIAIFVAAIFVLAALRAAPVIILLVVAAAAALFGQAWSDPGTLLRLYALAALVWIVPALFLGLSMPLMRRPAEMPREWGLVALLAAVCLFILTRAQFHYFAVLPFLGLVMAAVLIYRGMSVMDYWPIVALSTAILVYGTTLAFQKKTYDFISSVHDLNSQPADMARRNEVIWPTMPANINELLVSKRPIVLRDPGRDMALAPLPAGRPAVITLPELPHVANFKPTPTPDPLPWIPVAQPTLSVALAPVPKTPPTSELTKEEMTQRRLELALSASVGFWTTVGLLAIWALRRKASEPAAAE